MFTHPFELRSAVRLANGVEPEATNITSQFIGTLDYIFIEPFSLEVIAAVRFFIRTCHLSSTFR
jgi:mRNA deadenylase 3'-5' endonuclease subunit Ccr4